jgi:hypothetical protein
MTATKLTIKELRTEAQRLGITTELTGGALEELLRLARDNEDPLGYLAIHAPPEEGKEGTGDVPALLPLAHPLAETPEPRKIAVPVARTDLDNCYVSRHVELRMSPPQARTLRCVLLGLDAAGERLLNGRRVASAADALRWLLERIGGANEGLGIGD